MELSLQIAAYVEHNSKPSPPLLALKYLLLTDGTDCVKALIYLELCNCQDKHKQDSSYRSSCLHCRIINTEQLWLNWNSSDICRACARSKLQTEVGVKLTSILWCAEKQYKSKKCNVTLEPIHICTKLINIEGVLLMWWPFSEFTKLNSVIRPLWWLYFANLI